MEQIIKHIYVVALVLVFSHASITFASDGSFRPEVRAAGQEEGQQPQRQQVYSISPEATPSSALMASRGRPLERAKSLMSLSGASLSKAGRGLISEAYTGIKSLPQIIVQEHVTDLYAKKVGLLSLATLVYTVNPVAGMGVAYLALNEGYDERKSERDDNPISNLGVNLAAVATVVGVTWTAKTIWKKMTKKKTVKKEIVEVEEEDLD